MWWYGGISTVFMSFFWLRCDLLMNSCSDQSRLLVDAFGTEKQHLIETGGLMQHKWLAAEKTVCLEVTDDGVGLAVLQSCRSCLMITDTHSGVDYLLKHEYSEAECDEITRIKLLDSWGVHCSLLTCSSVWPQTRCFNIRTAHETEQKLISCHRTCC